MADHFDNVKRKMRNPSSSTDEDWEPIEEQNDLTRNIRKG